MSIKHCTLPWTWLVFDANGTAMPCCQAKDGVGNLRDTPVEDLWNSPVMRQVRRSIKAGEIPSTCQGSQCAFVQAQTGRAPAMPGKPAELDDTFAQRFDEAWYLAQYPDVAKAVRRHQLESGLDHFVTFGRAEARKYQLREHASTTATPHAAAWIDFAQGQTFVRIGPRDLVIGVTNVCNLACVMCPHGVGAVKRPRHLDESLVAKLEPFIAQATRVELIGVGEPTLAPLFWRIVELAHNYPHVYLRSNTNAHFLTDQNVARLVNSTFSELSISIDAATPETYRKIRGSDLKLVHENVRRLTRRRREVGNRRLELTANMILMHENRSEAVAFEETAAELGIDAVAFSQLMPIDTPGAWQVTRPQWEFNYAAQTIPPNDSQTRDILVRACERAERLGLGVHFVLGVGERLLGTRFAEHVRDTARQH